MKKVFTIIFIIVFCLSFSGCNNNKNTNDLFFNKKTSKMDGQLYMGGKIEYPDSMWQTPDYEYDPALDPTNPTCEGVKAFFINSPIKYKGKPTKIMGYIGFPENASEDNKVPAIVLVHGGIGTAYSDWVKMWNDRGYAAISIDTEGGQSKPDGNMYSILHDERNKYANDIIYTAGPSNNGFAIDGGLSNIQNSWMYHATSATILANSLIRSDNRVDSSKVGITGISWGGVITSIVLGYDDRFAFAMPVYGCIALNGSSGAFNSFPDDSSKETWDSVEPMKISATPTLFINSNKDKFFGLDAVSKCYNAVQNGFIAIKNDLPHSQADGANPFELVAFADAVVGKDTNVIKITQNPTKEIPVMKYKKGNDVIINSIELWYNNDSELSPSSIWNRKTLDFNDETVNIDYPNNAKYCYVNITFSNSLIHSSRLIEL